jgi:phospho-N-acetylmuramoyl-pentapeptide-transferase
MLKLILEFFSEYDWVQPIINLFKYVTFRALFSLTLSFILVLLVGNKFIYLLNKYGIKDTSGDFLSLPHHSKRGTPTIGGIIILFGILVATLLTCDLTNQLYYVLICGTLIFALIGFIDDFRKVKRKSSLKGLSQMEKTIGLLLFIIPFAIFISGRYSPLPIDERTVLYLPFLKTPFVDLGNYGIIIFIIIMMFTVVNAVNITDGQDGLLSGTAIPTISVYAILAFIMGNYKLAMHYNFPYVSANAEVVVFLAATVGALIGFLWFNFYPAQVFMGDTGSLTIGGILAISITVVKQELLFFIIGGVFILEITSSFLQEKVGNRIGRRIFHRAPYHHNLVFKGISEPKSVMRLILISSLLALIGLLSVKIR